MVQSSEREQQHFRLLPYISRYDKKVLKGIAKVMADERDESGSEGDWFSDSEASNFEGEMTVTVTFIYLSIAGFWTSPIHFISTRHKTPLFTLLHHFFYFISFVILSPTTQQ